MRFDEQTDVVIVGSGAGGSPVAAVLAEVGVNVVLLEKGPYYTARDFVHDEVRVCRRDFWKPYLSEEPHTLRKTTSEKAARSQEGWTSRCVGGATVHMSGFFYRLHKEDFELATLTGGIANANLADWPIALEELSPFYDEMEARIGVSGRDGSNPLEPRNRPYPLPPMRPHPAAQLIDEAACALGYHSFPTPRAVVTRPYGNRPPCNLCGLCGDYGCENASKSSALVTFVAQAEATGRCDVRPRAMVTQVLVNDSDAVVGVEYVDHAGLRKALGAKVVVVAASAIETARLLLLSQSARFPSGLANRGGLVGKNLTFSTFGKGTAAFDKFELIERLGTLGMDLPFLQRSIQDHYYWPGSGLPLPKGGTYNFILHHPNPINAAVRLAMDSKWTLFGEALANRIHDYFHDELWMEFEVFGEHLPWSGCFMDLDPQVKDRFGLPVARITAANHPACDDMSTLMTRRGMELLDAVRPAAKRLAAWTWKDTTYHLQQGTCRFGRDPSTSVLDPSCEAHEVKGLYVTDSSFMPTSGGCPATPTILANALRVGRIIAERLNKREV